MKSTVINEKGISESEYPYLKILDNTDGNEKGAIVLFTGHDTGVAVKGKGDHETGHYATNWAEDMCFIPFDGQIILEND
jgi:hypothetical protein